MWGKKKRKKGTTKSTVKYDISTVECDIGTIKYETKK